MRRAFLALAALAAAAADRSSFDCIMRTLAIEYAAARNPALSAAKLQQMADALDGTPEKPSDCHVVVPPTLLRERAGLGRFGVFPLSAEAAAAAFFVSYKGGDDANAGTEMSPFKTVERALQATRAGGAGGTIVLREGTHYLAQHIALTAADSNTVFQAFPHEEVWLSRGTPLTGVTWAPAAARADNGTAAPNLYTADLTSLGLASVAGLRDFSNGLGGKRQIRARFPNADPEINGFGSSLRASSWVAPTGSLQPAIEIRPATPFRPYGDEFKYFQAGSGGVCSGDFAGPGRNLGFDPPVGYWCGNQSEGGGAFTWRSPTGMTAGVNVLPHQPYANGTGMVVQAWHPEHWASRMYLVGPGDYTFDAGSKVGSMTFLAGGFQDARGSNDAGEFYVENVIEELDVASEWYYDEVTHILHFAYNGTGAPPTDGSIVAIAGHAITIVNITAPMAAPATGISFLGLGFRDAAYTYLMPHGMPSAGDWGLQRHAALILDGTENVVVQGCVFERLDGNAVIVSGYNRNAVIDSCEFAWIGDTCIAEWGRTRGTPVDGPDGGQDGWDATNGDQPRYTQITNNFAREMGIWEKQSSFLIEAKSSDAYIANNVQFNGPRALINFNDGFGGNRTIIGCVMFNSCRESGDHGPFNSWDRQVFTTYKNVNTDQVIKDNDTITENFMISNYQGQEAIDNDDGSAYYNTHHNFLIYSGNGMKNDFGGHDNHAHDNVYAYVGQGFGICGQLAGHVDYFVNNIVVQDNDGNYANGACSGDGKTVVGNNTIYTPTGRVTECGTTLAAWQAQGNDPGTTNHSYADLTDAMLLGYARNVLGM